MVTRRKSLALLLSLTLCMTPPCVAAVTTAGDVGSGSAFGGSYYVGDTGVGTLTIDGGSSLPYYRTAS
jgi:hypothetical protein